MPRYSASLTPEVSEREQKHMDFIRRKAGECMTLLQNNGVLPLAGPGKLALFGNGARGTVKGGTGSGDVNSRFVVSIEQGLEAAGFTVTTKRWLDEQEQTVKKERADYMAELDRIAAEQNVPSIVLALNMPYLPKRLAPVTEADIAASDTDTAVYVLARNSGEGCDRFNEPGDYQLLPQEIENLTLLGKHYARVAVLLNVGGIINAASIKDIPGIGAVLLVSQSGNVGGHIVADVLLGKAVPSGHLTDTWAVRYEDYPSSAGFSHNNGDCNDEYYTDDIYVGYRYFDTFNVDPLYPFGYGLSYTDFSIRTLGVKADEQTVTVTAEVKNTGDTYSGKQVVQVYASSPAGTLEKPYQMLVGFGKTGTLAPGAAQTLEITFPLTNLESYDPARSAYVLEAGDYYIRVGAHSRDTHIAAALRLNDTVLTKKVKHICPLDAEMELLSAAGKTPYSYDGEAQEKSTAPVIAIDAAKIPTTEITYQGVPAPLPKAETDAPITMQDVRAGKHTLEELVSQLTVEEMADLCVGVARDDSGKVIGSGAEGVVGAAGETSSLLKGRDVRPMINADGPAGLRLTPHFRTDAAGKLLPGGEVFGDMINPLPPKNEGDIDYYQYCTAIPIASLLAMSWDLPLIEDVGSMVGAEMAEFGVHVWLAPGMNIHRNPLCGRNFEYYSEDPLLSGLCAAYDVRGVQKHPGVGTSIKHFCLNNQEDNRMFVNGHVSERALREVYLRNFGVAIQASQPMTIMTSYNLVNGVHAANCYDSITCYAREECGFEGYVMTDWYTSHEMSYMFAKPSPKYPCSASPQCVYAGNDVQMPGCEKNVTDLIDAVKDASLPLGYLQQCCIRLLKADLACACFEGSAPYAQKYKLTEFVRSL